MYKKLASATAKLNQTRKEFEELRKDPELMAMEFDVSGIDTKLRFNYSDIWNNIRDNPEMIDVSDFDMK